MVRLTGLMICIPEALLFLELAFTVALFFFCAREGEVDTWPWLMGRLVLVGQ